MLKQTRILYREALARWLPYVTVHLFLRLLVAALLVPLIAALLALSLGFSDQSAVTDQDIARFLATPAGALGGLAVISLLIVASVLDVAVMTTIQHQHLSRPAHALQAAARFVFAKILPLARFALALLLRVLLLALPFVVLAGAVALVLLRSYDINYYLTARPPSFIAAALLIGALAAVFAGLLIHRLTGWAVALHLCLFEGLSARASFTESIARMTGHRRALIVRLAGWFAVRAALGAAIALVAGLCVALAPDLAGRYLRGLTLLLGFVWLGWSLANTFLNAIANGALADLLNDEFERAQVGHVTYEDTSMANRPFRLLAPETLIPAAAALAALGSLGAGGLLLSEVRADTEVEVIGHRGAAALRPENTMASVLKAIEDGADWVEIDVQESAEGEIIIAHDSDFMKTAGVPTKVWEITAADLAEVDIGSWFDPAYAAERPPTLRDVLAAAKDRARVIIELKYYGHDVDLENRVIALVEEAGMADQIATMSLKYPAVQKMHALRPEWRAGVLAATAVGDLTGLEADFLAINTGAVSARLVARAHKAGKEVYAWTVNEPVTMMRMMATGVDGLITDDPALAREVIAHYAALSAPERVLLVLADRVGVALDSLAPAPELRP